MNDVALLSRQNAKDPSPAASKPCVIGTAVVPHARTWWRFRSNCLRTDCGFPFCRCFPTLETA